MSGIGTLKICFLGSSNVGKTSIIQQLINGEIPEKSKATIEDFHEYLFSFRKTQKKFSLMITDTGGGGEVLSLREYQIQNNELFVLVYDMTVKESLEEIHSIYEDILLKHHSKFIPIVVFGNKNDLVESKEKKKTVTIKDAQDVFDHVNTSFIEGSAKNGKNISLLFESLITLMESHDNQVNSTSSSRESVGKKKARRTAKRRSESSSGSSSRSSSVGKKRNKDKKRNFCFSPNTKEDIDEDIGNFY